MSETVTIQVVSSMVTPRRGPGRSYEYIHAHKKVKGDTILCNLPPSTDNEGITWYSASSGGGYFPISSNGTTYCRLMDTMSFTITSKYVTPRVGPRRSSEYAQDPSAGKTQGDVIICYSNGVTDSEGITWYKSVNGYYYPTSDGKSMQIMKSTGYGATVNTSSSNNASLNSFAATSVETLTTIGVTGDALQISQEQNKLLDDAIDGSVRLFGLPHQLTAENDKRISNNSKLGRVFAETFVMDAPIIYLRPGTSNFLPGKDSEDHKGLLNAIAALHSDTDRANSAIKKKLAEMQDDEKMVKYFTFQEQFADYQSKVNMLCRLGSVFLKIHKVKVPWHGSGSTMTFGSYDWRGFKFKNLYTNKDLKAKFAEDYFGNLGAFVANTLTTSIASDDTYVQFYVDGNASFSQSVSNSTTQSILTSFTDNVESIGKELAFISGATSVGIDNLATEASASVDDFIESTFDGDGALSTLFRRLTGVGNQLISGSNFLAPDIWSDSSHSESHSFTITLSTPYGNKISWYLNIFVPLMHLLAMALPVQQGANAFSAPHLIRAFSPGWFSCDMGVISSLNIDKGGSGDAWSSSGLPTEVKVSIDIKDLYKNLAIPNMYNIKEFFNNDNLLSYLMVNCGLDLSNQDLFTKIDVMKNIFLGSIEDKIVGTISDKYIKFKDIILSHVNTVF